MSQSQSHFKSVLEQFSVLGLVCLTCVLVAIHLLTCESYSSSLLLLFPSQLLTGTPLYSACNSFWQNFGYFFKSSFCYLVLFKDTPIFYCYSSCMRWCWLAVIGVMFMLVGYSSLPFLHIWWMAGSFHLVALQKICSSRNFLLCIGKQIIPSHGIFGRCHIMEVLCSHLRQEKCLCNILFSGCYIHV